MPTQDEAKELAARAAVEELPEKGVIGLGTGSTARLFIDEVGAKDGPRSVPGLNTRRGPEVEQSHSTSKGK